MPTHHGEMVERAWESAALDFEYHRAIVKHRETFLATPQADFHSVIAQYWPGRNIPITQFWAIAQLRTLWRIGAISHCILQIGQEPGADLNLERHRSLLQGEKSFTSLVNSANIIRIKCDVVNRRGAGADDDGTVTLLSGVDFDLCSASIADETASDVRCPSPGARFPLEIGYTSASRTYLHLVQERCVARWPYGKTYLCLLRVDLSLLETSLEQISVS